MYGPALCKIHEKVESRKHWPVPLRLLFDHVQRTQCVDVGCFTTVRRTSFLLWVLLMTLIWGSWRANEQTQGPGGLMSDGVKEPLYLWCGYSLSTCDEERNFCSCGCSFYVSGQIWLSVRSETNRNSIWSTNCIQNPSRIGLQHSLTFLPHSILWYLTGGSPLIARCVLECPPGLVSHGGLT